MGDRVVGGATLVNAGNRTFNVVTTTALPLEFGASLVVADFNGDGRADVAAVSPGEQSVAIFYGQPDGTFVYVTSLDCGAGVGGLAVGDFDGDGRVDIAAGLISSQQAVIFFNQGNDQFSRSYFASGASTTSMTAADLNHRGKTDLIFSNFQLDSRPANADVVFHK